MSKLPSILSPCNHVRSSCYSLMDDELCSSFHRNDGGGQDGTNPASSSFGRCVKIHTDTLNQWIDDTVIPSLVLRRRQEKPPLPSEQSSSTYSTTTESWDEEEWHYTAKKYQRPWLSSHEQAQQRYERIALYIMTLDCINFCFWPITSSSTTDSNLSQNLFEYEHFAKALKILAEQDDDTILEKNEGNTSINSYTNHVQKGCETFGVAEDSYALAPQNFHVGIFEKFCHILIQLAPANKAITTTATPPISDHDINTLVPMMEQRLQLWQQLMCTLTYQFHGSATYFLSTAHQSADHLVYNILAAFPGFRDTAMEGSQGRWIAFYKRAQIMVGDLWAALKSPTPTTLEKNKQYWYPYCDFNDIETLTTFADYRIPQLFHSLQVFEYTPALEQKVQSKEKLWPGSREELYIRAATVVTVEQMVTRVRKYFMEHGEECLEQEDGSKASIRIIKEINAVTMDWYLWNLGETLDRQGTLYPHHRVRTIYY